MGAIIQPIMLSLKVAAISTIITLILGIAFAYFFVRCNFDLKDFFEAFLVLPMVLPPSVLEYF